MEEELYSPSEGPVWLLGSAGECWVWEQAQGNLGMRELCYGRELLEGSRGLLHEAELGTGGWVCGDLPGKGWKSMSQGRMALRAFLAGILLFLAGILL